MTFRTDTDHGDFQLSNDSFDSDIDLQSSNSSKLMEDLGDRRELSDSSYFSDNEDDEEEDKNDHIRKTTDQDKPIYENASLTISGSMMSFGSDGYFIGTSENKKQKEIHLSLQINTNGVSISKSSQRCIWPIYFTINELPPKQR